MQVPGVGEGHAREEPYAMGMRKERGTISPRSGKGERTTWEGGYLSKEKWKERISRKKVHERVSLPSFGVKKG